MKRKLTYKNHYIGTEHLSDVYNKLVKYRESIYLGAFFDIVEELNNVVYNINDKQHDKFIAVVKNKEVDRYKGYV